MKATILSTIIAIVFIGGAILLARGANTNIASETANNVSVVDGKQIIEIGAKGGYSPRITLAKANMPTVIKVKTQGTFDCSSAINIPSLGYRNNLPSSGITEIEVPAQKVGTTLRGLCAMGMYNFSVDFN